VLVLVGTIVIQNSVDVSINGTVEVEDVDVLASVFLAVLTVNWILRDFRDWLWFDFL
jgi:hypothetical protein